MITGAEASEQFNDGIERMRQLAIEKVTAWHVAKWNNETTLTNEEVHELINAMAGDIQVARP